MRIGLRVLRIVPRPWMKAAARLQWRHPVLKRLFDRLATWIRRGDQTVLTGVGRGLRLEVGTSNAGYVLGTSEPHVQEALRLLITPGMTVFDIGANVGFFSMIAARLVGPGGRVVAFEPLAENAALIARNAALNAFGNVTVRQEAIGSADSRQEFLTSEVASWGRLASAPAPPAQQVGRIQVPVRTLDSLLEHHEVPPPAFIKIDVEGAETEVLAGARGVLQRLCPLMLIELHGTNARVQEQLDAANYGLVVLGTEHRLLHDAPWNAHLVAAPSSDRRLARHRAALTRVSLTGSG